jgi:hypothetical protein
MEMVLGDNAGADLWLQHLLGVHGQCTESIEL